MFSFGSDPEFMLMDENGKHKSAIGIIKGNKFKRIKVKNHEFYYDNVLAECAIKPSYSKEETIYNFKECLQIYAKIASPYKLVPQAAQHFDKSELQCPEAKEVGCDPEFCPYEMAMKSDAKEEILYGTLRTCGGHIHLGAEELTEGNLGVLAMYMMDLFLGVPALWMEKDPTSVIRRSMYGSAGRYRVKSYGMEYRALSNFWLQNPRLTGFVFDVSKFVTEYVISGEANQHWSFDWDLFYNTSNLKEAWTCLTYDPDALQIGIKTGNKDLVEKHYQLAQEIIPSELKHEMLSLCDAKTTDFYTEWQLDD